MSEARELDQRPYGSGSYRNQQRSEAERDNRQGLRSPTSEAKANGEVLK